MNRVFATCIVALLGASPSLFAQEPTQGIPADVFYFMPKMTQGTLYFRGSKGIVPGSFNICAVDNTVRFLDKGKELALDDGGTLVKVVLGNNVFVPIDGVFYRLEKVNEDVQVAVKRNVVLLTDSRMASYGMDSQTTAVQEIMSIQADGRTMNFEEAKDIPFRVSQEACLYRKESLLSPSKKNYIKCFPGKKNEIEAWFKENKSPDSANPEQIIALARMWAE